MNKASQINIFDRHLLRQRFEKSVPAFSNHSILIDRVSDHLAERLQDVKRDFRFTLNLGSRVGGSYSGKNPEALTVVTNISEGFARYNGVSHAVVVDEEYLPFSANSFDLVLSNLALHWVNDLPGVLMQVRNVLQPGGMFLASMLGGQTLIELRTCLLEAEIKITGGASPRLSPVVDSPTASGLLQRAGFNLPVVDREIFTFVYPDSFTLMRDLRGMGEANVLRQRLRHPTRRTIFEEADRLYRMHYSDGNGRISASFEVIFLHGWKE